MRSHPAGIQNPAVGVYMPDAAVRAHAQRKARREQPEALSAAQKHVEVVMEIVVKPAGRSCAPDFTHQEGWSILYS